MRFLPDGDQMKRADAFTIEQIGIPSLVLMERAALSVVEVLHKEKIDVSRVLIVCGSGNNGGDGFAVGRLLREEGYSPEILFAGNEDSMSTECKLQKKIVENMGITVFKDLPDREYTVMIDAVFGVGLSREITGRYRDIIQWMNGQNCAKAAVDIPSGVCARTGKIFGTAFRADLTVSMECCKIGACLPPGNEYTGKMTAVPVGISRQIFTGDSSVCFTYERSDLPALIPKRPDHSNKGDYGRVLMITGSDGMAGAAVLSAQAAYAAGAGLVRVYTAEENRIVLQQSIPEAIISCYSKFDAGELDKMLAWADVICIGCGLGQSKISEQILVHTMKNAGVTCIVDADGLNILSRNMDILTGIKVPVILTPHLKEMSRMLGADISAITEDRLSAAVQFAEKYPVVLAMKDSRTIVTEKGRQIFVNLAGNSAMAKAGSGDVLAGIITGLAAQKMSAYDSAALGVYLHACGGDEARKEKGSHGVIARDLVSGVVKCMRETEETMKDETA